MTGLGNKFLADKLVLLNMDPHLQTSLAGDGMSGSVEYRHLQCKTTHVQPSYSQLKYDLKIAPLYLAVSVG